MNYIQTWYNEFNTQKTGYTLYSATELYNLINPYYKEPFPLSMTKFGRDLKKYNFISKRRVAKGFQYSVKWEI